ncbi:MAG: uroporphyrinogen-III C-methyltransferase [Alphaproteobacteria bacterium]|nr:MAG: uroporphyrinogen-III C-methyltransferase [Alphaproteobacteria bacterium]
MDGVSAATKKTPIGHVALVGAGPGDPDLLTIRAARLLGQAEVVFVDRLVGAGVMDLISPAAEIVPVGKSKGEHSVPQGEIHRRMIDAARAGKRVVRLKGGDPFIFGRGGEELEALRAANIEVEIVPGISSALGCAASTQIPLTHRDMAQAVTFVTGHAALGEEPDLDWHALARPNQTVVVFMGVGTAGTIAARLVAAGRDPSTPVAVIENGTRANEIAAFGPLGELSEIIYAAGINGPALLIIGEVTALAQRNTAINEQGAKEQGKAAKPNLSALWEMLS